VRATVIAFGAVLLLSGVLVASVAIPPRPAAAATSVSQPTVQVSSPAAGATAVTYTIAFTASATGGVAAGGTITLVSAPGTVWPAAQQLCAYTLTDATTPSGSFSCATGLAFAESGLPVHNFLNPSGSVVTITVPNAIAAGDQLSLAVSGVQNPSAGTGTVGVATSGDPAVAYSAIFTVVAPTSVSQPTVQVTSPAAGATAVTYTVGFTASATGGVPAGGTITLFGAPGTVWPTTGSAYQLSDATTPSASFTAASGVASVDSGQPVYNFLSPSGSIVTITVPNAIVAGDRLSLAAAGVQNPPAGTATLGVATSGDPVTARSAGFPIIAPSSVAPATVQVSSATAGATGVTYTIGFTTSATGGVAAGGSITLVGPSGTVWPAGGSAYQLTDATMPSGSFASASGAVVAGTGNIVTVTVPAALNSNDVLNLLVSGTTNAGAGSQHISVSTSGDPAPSQSSAYVLTGAAAALTSVSGATFSSTATAFGASGVTYTVGFTATTALTAGVDTITLVGPPGTIFGGCPYGCGGGNALYTLTDTTNGAGSGATSPTALADADAAVTVAVPHTVAAGDQLSLVVTQVTNPASAGSLTVWTSADTTPVTLNEGMSAAASPASPTFSATTTAAAAGGVTETVTFTASGGLVGGTGTVNLLGAPGTVFDACPYGCGGGNGSYTFTDATTPGGSGSAGAVAVADGGAAVSIVVPNSINAGDHITLVLTGATNPVAGAAPVAVSTSSDIVAATAPFTASPASAVSGVSLGAADVSPGATTAWTVAFMTSATGSLVAGDAAVTVAAPPGTVFSTSGTVTLTDHTSATGSGTVATMHVADGGAVASFVLPGTVNAGDVVTLSVGSVTNPPAGNYQVAVSTSSDTAPAATTLNIGAGLAVGGVVNASGGGPASGAEVELCPASGTCASANTDANGAFTFDEPAGTYALTALPPSGSHDGGVSVQVTTTTTPLTTLVLALTSPPTLAGGVTLTTANGVLLTSATSDPSVNWRDPFQMTFPRSMFPTTGTVVATQLVINGTDPSTGQPATKVVNIGGSIAGLPVGVVLGAGPLTVAVPSLAPLHGTVSFAVNFEQYSTTPVPTGITSTQVHDLIYPPAPPSEQPTDPLPAYFVNYTAPAGTIVGPGTITGADASYFSLVPLTTYGVPAGTVDCSTTAAALQPFLNNVPNPPPGTVCGMAVQFTPPPLTAAPHQIYYNAVLEAPVTYSGSQPATAYVQLHGCDARVAAEAGYESCFQGTGGESDPGEGGQGGGGGGGGGGGDGGGTSGGGGGWSDPSGVVLVTDGHTTPVPIAGATVTIARSGTATGPFTPIPNGSAEMSPGNRTNPDVTRSGGQFGWDVVAGYYQVTASGTGCAPASTPVLTVPPPQLGLSITLTCSTLPARAPTATMVGAPSTSPYGAPVDLTATVTATGGGQPTGAVEFDDGATSLGQGVIDATGAASLVVSSLGVGPHSITASYSGDGAFAPSASSAAPLAVAAPPAALSLTTTSLPSATVGTAYNQALSATGGTTPYAWSLAQGSALPAALSLDPVTGVISGTPTAPGTTTFTVVVTDHGAPQQQATKQLQIVVTAAAAKGPAVSGVFPAQGPVDGGTVVAVTGANLTNGKFCTALVPVGPRPPPSCGEAVTFGSHAARVLVASPTLLIVVAPPGAAGPVDVAVTVGNVTSTASPKDVFTYTTPRPRR
jgi:hypothetical protein